MDDNDIVLKIILNIKQLQSPHHYNYNENGTEERNCWNHFQEIFYSLCTIKILTANQNPSYFK